jgi:hypothetical protein
MAKPLKWEPMMPVLPMCNMWGAIDREVTFIISHDLGITLTDPYYGVFVLSGKLAGGKRIDYGKFPTLTDAMAAAEKARKL